MSIISLTIETRTENYGPATKVIDVTVERVDGIEDSAIAGIAAVCAAKFSEGLAAAVLSVRKNALRAEVERIAGEYLDELKAEAEAAEAPSND